MINAYIAVCADVLLTNSYNSVCSTVRVFVRLLLIGICMFIIKSGSKQPHLNLLSSDLQSTYNDPINLDKYGLRAPAEGWNFVCCANLLRMTNVAAS